MWSFRLEGEARRRVRRDRREITEEDRRQWIFVRCKVLGSNKLYCETFENDANQRV
jgi:hypothetical protein